MSKDESRVFVIHKYALPYGARTVLKMQTTSKVLTCQMQRDNLVMWARLFIDDRSSERFFAVLPTGARCVQVSDEHYEYINTVQDGDIVWHVFEVRARE